MPALLRRTRVRLTLAYTALFAVLMVAAGAGVWLSLRHAEYTRVDDSLRGQGRALLAGVNDENGHITFEGGGALPATTAEGIAVGATLVSGDGRVLASAGPALPAATATRLGGEALRVRGEVVSDLTSAGSGERVLAEPVPGTGGALVLSRPVGEVERTLTEAALLLAVGGVVLALLSAVLGYRLAGRALRPVREITALAREISDHDLHRRIELDLPEDELGRLAATFNAMLARLEVAFAGLQRFTADAAHELRAPLALIRTELEVALRRPRQGAADEAVLASLLEETERLTATAEALLLLARSDAGALGTRREPIDVGDLLEETRDRWAALAAQRRRTVRVDGESSGAVSGDPELLRRLLDNLVDNALRHGAGTVRLAATELEGGWRLEVSDEGPGIPAELRPCLFERFTRGDPARARESGGAGLGLALCAAIVAVHGGSIEAAEATPGTRLVVRLPRA